MMTDLVAVAATAAAVELAAVGVEFAAGAAEDRLLIDYVVMIVADFAQYLAAHSMGRIHYAKQEMAIETVVAIENKNFDLSQVFSKWWWVRASTGRKHGGKKREKEKKKNSINHCIYGF